MSTQKEYTLIAIGAALGGVIRYGVEETIGKIFNGPIAIVCVNVLGCFIMAFGTGIIAKRGFMLVMSNFLLTGFCGGLTTFSSLVGGTRHLFETGSILSGIINLMVNIVFAFVAVCLGFYLSVGTYNPYREGTESEKV